MLIDAQNICVSSAQIAPHIISVTTVNRGASAELQPSSNRWNRAIDRLIEFSELPLMPDEDGNEPPTRAAIKTAAKLLQDLRNRRLPDTIVLDGDGGIVMELFRQTTAERFEIGADGRCELLHFEDCRLISRQEIPAFDM